MEYCPKCGNKVDETMTFCPRCGTSLRTGTAPQGPTPTSPPYEYRRRHEKQEKNEKAEKHEKGGGGRIGLLIAGVAVIFIGLLGYVNATTDILSGPVASAIVLVVIGLIILFAGVYFYTRARSRNPVPT